MLFPHEVLLLREEKRIRKTALIRNFVDREKERPALGPNDFLLRDVTSMKTLTYPRKTGELRYNVLTLVLVFLLVIVNTLTLEVTTKVLIEFRK